ncbi:hypothetical protein BsWGS_05689 [Bradybaena similaris]
MENDAENCFQLDRDFDKCLADMKPYVLKLPHKSERQKCAVWIQKLCEPVGSGTIDRRTRNQHTQLMLKMLKKGSLHSPFDQKPDDGPLKPLPSYMVEGLPNWVEDQLGNTAGSSVIAGYLRNPAATSTWVSSLGELTDRPHSSLDKLMEKDPLLSSIRSFDHKGYSADDINVEVKWDPSRHHKQCSTSEDTERRHLPEVKSKELRDEVRLKESTNDMEWSRPLTSILTSSYSLPKGLTFCDDSSYIKPGDRETEVRIKMVEAKFQKEKLKLQQKHDVDVQKILNRKNNEIEDMKGHYKAKSKEMEETIGKLERKVQTLMKETEFIKQTKDKQISELRKITDESNEARRNDFDKRLHDAMAEFEQVKFELQKQHTQNIQEILDDTNNRLQHMEAEYSQQTTASTNLIKKLESRVQQLMNEVDFTLSQRSEVEKEKNEALAKCDKLATAHERLKEKLCQLEREQQMNLENHKLEILGLKSKAEAGIEHMLHEHTFAASKAANTISELEENIDHLKKSLKDAESNWHQQIKELEETHQRSKTHLENIHEKQISKMKKEMEKIDENWTSKVTKLEQQIREKEGAISKLKEQNQQHSLQAKKALEEFKAQVETNQKRIYEEMKQQMHQVVADLTKSKQAREKQSKEFSRHLDEERCRHQSEISETRMAFEAEKTKMLRDFHMQKEYILKEHEHDIEHLKELQETEIHKLETRIQEKQDKFDKSSAENEQLIRELREELVQANQLRKQQLVELGLLREEEKQKIHRDHEAELVRLKAVYEQQKLQQSKAHSAEMEAVLEKTNDQLRNIDREYAEQCSKSKESISELQSVITQMKLDIKRLHDNSEEKLAELQQNFEQEKESLHKQYSQTISKATKELESQRSKTRNAERRLQKLESEQEEMVTQLKLQFEEKVRGLLPVNLKQDLEETIASLKSQIFSLQKKSELLQGELDDRCKDSINSLSSNASLTIKSSV